MTNGTNLEDMKTVFCYITNEEEAFFIMERLHSGEDKGRGTKKWSSREKKILRYDKIIQKIYLI